MILIYIFLIIATNTMANHQHRRSFNTRKQRITNEYQNYATPYTNSPVDEHRSNRHRNLNQYIPIQRQHKLKEPGMSARSDDVMETEFNDLIRNVSTNRSVINFNNLRKYVTSDQIRPARFHHATSQHPRSRSNNKPTQKQNNEDINDYNRFQTRRQSNLIKEKRTFENINDFESNDPSVFTTTSSQANTQYNPVYEEEYLQNPFLSPILKKSAVGYLPPIESSPPPVQYLPPIQNTEIFSPSQEIVTQEYQSLLIPPNYDERTYENNPFLNKEIFKQTSLIKPEVIQFNAQDISPLKSTATVKAPLYESALFNQHAPEQSGEIQHLPTSNIMEPTGFQHSSLFERGTETQSYPQPIQYERIPLDAQTVIQSDGNESGSIQYYLQAEKPQNQYLLQADNNPSNVQHLPIGEDKPVIIDHIYPKERNQITIQHLPPAVDKTIDAQLVTPTGESNIQGNVYLPLKYSNNDRQTNTFSNEIYGDDLMLMDPYSQDEIKKMSFESAKISNKFTTPSPIQKPSQSPLKETYLPVQELSTIPIINKALIDESVKPTQNIIDAHLNEESNLRRNDYVPYYQEDYYPNKLILQNNLKEQYYTQSPNEYYASPIGRSSREENWYTDDSMIAEETDNSHLQTFNRMESANELRSQNTYGSKISQQQQYPNIIERSNKQNIMAYDDSFVEPIAPTIQSTTTKYESPNLNNAKQIQEYATSLSTVSQTIDYKNVRPSQDATVSQNNLRQNEEVLINHKQQQTIAGVHNNLRQNEEIKTVSYTKTTQAPLIHANHKTAQDYVSTSTISYPKEFTKALEAYVKKHTRILKEEKQEKQEKPQQVEKKIRQPKEYPKEFVQRSEQEFINTHASFPQYESQFSDQSIYVQPYNYSYNRGPTTEPVPVLRETKEMAIDGSFHYETLIGDQTHVIQEGHIENPGTEDEEQVMHGSYSFLGDDGKTYTVNYVADANGFRAAGDHLPTPPPIPLLIQKSIEKNLAEYDKNLENLEHYYKGNVNENNVIIERRSNGKPTFNIDTKTDNNRGQHTTNSYNNHQPMFHQVNIQPKKDGEQNKQLSVEIKNENGKYSQNPFIQRRSSYGFEEQFYEKPNVHFVEKKYNQKNNNQQRILKDDTANQQKSHENTEEPTRFSTLPYDPYHAYQNNAKRSIDQEINNFNQISNANVKSNMDETVELQPIIINSDYSNINRFNSFYSGNYVNMDKNSYSNNYNTNNS